MNDALTIRSAGTDREVEYEIRPIAMDEWLPDGCMGFGPPIDPSTDKPGSGCDSLQRYTKGSRDRLVAMYSDVLAECGCCGFVAWVPGGAVGYNNFFPREWARRIQFYGWGTDEGDAPQTLVHNCISIRGNPEYRRQGIGTSLIRHSLAWANDNGWQRFEVHLVTHDTPENCLGNQKSCRSFWEKLGFGVFRENENGTFSMATDIDNGKPCWGRELST